jgi:hypothetical protein
MGVINMQASFQEIYGTNLDAIAKARKTAEMTCNDVARIRMESAEVFKLLNSARAQLLATTGFVPEGLEAEAIPSSAEQWTSRF